MYPRVEPFRTGRLARPDGAELYWELSGNPHGRPALYLHGGPGGGLRRGGYRRRFDPEKYLIVGFDQRGCGRSTPWAMDDLDGLTGNTTQAQIADIEALREVLGVDQWLMHGVSWGSTLALAYALERPDRVSEIINVAVTTGSREEIDWLTEGVGRIFPEAWERFAAPAGDRRIVDVYAEMLRDPSSSVRRAAASAWDTWESTHISLDPEWMPGPLHHDPRDQQNFALLVSHYWSNDCFLTGSQRILDRAPELAGIPGVLIHGRRDVSGPAGTAWELHRRWPGSSLHIAEDEGHGGPKQMQLVADTTDGFVQR
ncbi:prolyl aminopeptidase [Microbacterium sp. NPDC058342]|uniref:prolyl aminopeptidase n=1 Tax=Microbacterium sp. NPDC058342 TaxID=3346454 RepID=UPI003659B74C